MMTGVRRSSVSVSSGNFFAPSSLTSGSATAEQRRAVAVLRVVVKSFAGKQFAGDVGVDGFVRVHRPFAELRQADGEREQGDRKKDRPANFG